MDMRRILERSEGKQTSNPVGTIQETREKLIGNICRRCVNT